MIENIAVAERTNNLLCQDTGIPIYNVDDRARRGRRRLQLKQASDGLRARHSRTSAALVGRASAHAQERAHVVRSLGARDPFRFRSEPSTLSIEMIPKGSGSENNSWLKMAVPADGIDAIKTFVVDCVLDAGGKTCPPTIVGVGVGGTADLCVHLAKVAATRPLGSALRRCRRRDARSGALEGGEPARRWPAGPGRRLDLVRRARRDRGDAHHDESGRGEHAMPLRAPRARDVHAARPRHTGF